MTRLRLGTYKDQTGLIFKVFSFTQTHVSIWYEEDVHEIDIRIYLEEYKMKDWKYLG